MFDAGVEQKCFKGNKEVEIKKFSKKSWLQRKEILMRVETCQQPEIRANRNANMF